MQTSRVPYLAIWVLAVILCACGGDKSPRARLEKTRNLASQEKFEKALSELRPLITGQPTDSAVLILAAKVYFGLEKYDSAHYFAKQYAMLYPTRLDGYHMLYMTGEKVKNYDDQIWAVSQLGYLENDRRKYHVEIAQLNFLRGEYGMAMKTCEMVFEYDPNNIAALFVMANSLATIGQLDSAIGIMERLDKQNPNQVEILSNLASFFVSKRDYQQAIAHFQRLTTLFPDYLPGWYGLGNVLLQAGDTAAAKDAYGQVYRRDSTFLGVDSIYRHLNRGIY